MNYLVVSKCIICKRALSDTRSQSFCLAQANVGESFNEEKTLSYATFDSTKKLLICKECIMREFVSNNFPRLKVPKEIYSSLKFYHKDGFYSVGYKPNKLLNNNSTQEDVEKIIIEITKNVLKGIK